MSGWKNKKESWLRQSSLEESVSKWAIDSIRASEKEIEELDVLLGKPSLEDKSVVEIATYLKNIRRDIKTAISLKENGLDDISLNPPNSSKVQISVPSNLNYLMKAWAAAEGRDLSSVALQCLETGLRLIKSKGSIPFAAVERYELACEKRIALSEANNVWQEYEELSVKKLALNKK